MKKTCFILVFLFSLVFASAQLTLDSSHSFGETVLGSISSGDINLTEGEVGFEFMEGRKKITMTHDFMVHQGNVYFYIYPAKKGDYYVMIDVGVLEFQKNFSVVEGANSLSVRPGFVQVLEGGEITITNRGDSVLDVSTPHGSFSLSPLASKIINFVPSQEFSYFEVSSYKSFKVPVVSANWAPVFNDTVDDEEEEEDPEGLFLIKRLEVDPLNISAGLVPFGEITKTFLIKNTGDLEISGIYVTSDYNVSFDNTTLVEGEELEVEVSLDSNDSNGEIIVGFANTEIIIPVTIAVDWSLIEGEETCSEKGGVFCDVDLNLTCDGDSEYASDSICCLGQCVLIDNGSSGGSGWGVAIGILIFLILGAGGYILYLRLKRVKSTDNIKKVTSPKAPVFENKRPVKNPQEIGGLKAPNLDVSPEHMARHNRRVGLK
jgi:hypothetical protein